MLHQIPSGGSGKHGHDKESRGEIIRFRLSYILFQYGNEAMETNDT